MGFPAMVPSSDDSLLDWWLRTRDTFPETLRRSFDSLVLLVSWCLWKERNRRTFDHRALMTTELLGHTLEEADVWIASGFRSLALLTALAD
jgi:hypothetical protein